MRINRFANKFIHSLVDDISFKYKYINSDLKNFYDEYLGNNVLSKLMLKRKNGAFMPSFQQTFINIRQLLLLQVLGKVLVETNYMMN